MDRPFRSPTGWQQAQQSTPPAPAWQGKETAPAPAQVAPKPRTGNSFDRFRAPVVRGPRTENINAYMAEIEKLRKLVDSPDDSWLDGLSKEELIALRDRARLLAGNLSKVQDSLRPFKRS